MSHISLRVPGILPILSTSLARMVEQWASPDPEDRDRAAVYGRPPTLAQRAEAATALPTYQAALRPVSDAALIAWAEPINAAVRNPQSREDFMIRVSVWAHALANVPARCFSPESQREALLTFQFWPAAADVHALLKPQADALEAAAKAVKAIAEGANTPAPPARRAPTTNELTSIRDLIAENDAFLHAQYDAIYNPAPQKSAFGLPPTATTLTREQLNTDYARAGIKGPQVTK